MMVAPAALGTSPVCRSPLSQHSFRPDSPAPILIPAAPDPVPHLKRNRQASAEHGQGQRRQSITLSPRRLSTSRSLAGSYTLSLLSSRMSAAHPTHHVPSAFTLKIGSVSPARHIPSALKCPPHVKIAFDARWYSLDGAAAAWTPWVGNVDVEGWYRYQRRIKTLEWAREQCASAVDEDDDEEEGHDGPDLDLYYERILKGWHPTLADISHAPPADRALLHKMRVPPKPGYEVGVSGKMQFFIMQTVDQPLTNSTAPAPAGEQTMPVKVFLVDYDLASLEPGGRLLYKERAYQTITEDGTRSGPGSPASTTASPGNTVRPKAREVLKYAFELHFLCTERPRTKRTGPTQDPAAVSTEKKRKRADTTHNTHKHRSYYLGKQIRIVFPTSSSTLNNTDGAISASPHGPPPQVRVERLIEVQNPVVSALTPDHDLQADVPKTEARQGVGGAGAPVKLSESFTSESWEGLRARWAAHDPAQLAGEPEIGSAAVQDAGDHSRLLQTEQGKREGHRLSATTASTAGDGSSLVFARSPTPVQPLALKSPSLLTARLEEMSTLSPPPVPPSTPLPVLGPSREPPVAKQDELLTQGYLPASPSGGGRKRTLWPDDDSERLLSESLQKLPVSYR